MPVLIAHLSDLHFGSTFDTELWQSVESVVKDFSPDILVVSGDLVDDPREDHLRKVRATLDELARVAGAALYVVPGNHDLFPAGLAVAGERSGWFDHIFGGTLPDGAGPGKPVPTLAGPRTGTWETIRDRGSAILGIGKHRPAPRPRPRPDLTAAPMLHEPPGTNILMALIDSNATDNTLGLATGRVSDDDLAALDRQLLQRRGRHLARVAVIHHHVLPVAHTAGRLLGAEPMMVLQNAGDILGVLARHRFDLVLHGHRHRAQFARIDFSPEDAEGYPIAVASAGSAATRSPLSPDANGINLITISDNGRIAVESLHYGSAGAGPNRQGLEGKEVRHFHEPLESVRRRAFILACREHQVCAARRMLEFTVTQDGALIVEQGVEALRLVHGSALGRLRPQVIAIPGHGRRAFGPELDEASRAGGYTLRTGNGDFVELPEPLGRHPAKYKVRYGLANSMNMTLWEAEERATVTERAGGERDAYWDHESVSTYVNYPVHEIEMLLSLPASMSDVKPFVVCERRRGFPNFELDGFGNADLSANPAFDLDVELGEDIAMSLRRDGPLPIWSLKVRRPFVGYRYRLKWKLPRPAAENRCEMETRQWCRTLLSLVDRSDLPAAAAQAGEIFATLAAEVRGRIGSGAPGEDCTLSLYVYDEDRLAVRPVLWHGPEASTSTWKSFEIAIGDGVAGAAFLQCGTIPWSESRNRSVYVKPKINPVLQTAVRSMVAMPIFHDTSQDSLDPPPSSVVGVLCFATSELTPQISGLMGPENADAYTLLRQLAHIAVYEILARYGQGPAKPSV